MSVFMRGGIIIIIGTLYNLIAIALMGIQVPFPLSLWGWNILTFIGFSQIFCYYFLKLSKQVRVGLGLLVIFTSEWIRAILFFGKDENLLYAIFHFIITSPVASVTLLPWLALCIFGTIFGELLYEAMIDGSNKANMKLFKQYMLWGSIFVIIAIFAILPPTFQFGWQLQTADTLPGGLDEYPHIALYYTLNDNPFYNYDGMQNFLIRGTASNMFFLVGTNLLVIGLSFYIIDIRTNENDFINMLIFYGQVSLTLFLLHHIFLTLFVGKLNIVFFVFVALGFITLMGFLMYIWKKYGNGVGSAEWMMGQLGKKKKNPKLNSQIIPQ